MVRKERNDQKKKILISL